MSEPLTDEQLQAWAEKRADDAGRLARELLDLRARIEDMRKANVGMQAERDSARALLREEMDRMTHFNHRRARIAAELEPSR